MQHVCWLRTPPRCPKMAPRAAPICLSRRTQELLAQAEQLVPEGDLPALQVGQLWPLQG